MATTDGIYTPDATGVDANVPVEMLGMANSLKGRTVRSFATTNARDSAFALYTAAQKKGVICFVEGDGPFISDGAVWRRISVPGMNTNRGTAQGNCDSNGIYVVNHGLIAAPVSVQITMEGDADQIKYLHPVVVQINSTQFLVKFWYNNPAGSAPPYGALQLNNGGYTSFHWRAEL